MTLTQNQFTLRVEKQTRILHTAHTRSLSRSRSRTHLLSKTKGRGQGFIYTFLMPAKPLSFVAAPADSITANGNIVGFVPSH